MRRVLRGARDRGGTNHLVGEANCPFPRLLRAHRPAHDEGQALDAEVFTQQLLLGAHVVADPHVQELRHRDARVVGVVWEVESPLPI